MDFLELATKRFSVRKFQNVPIEAEHMNKILQAGHVAPTACNNQPQKIYVLQSTEALQKLYKCTRCHFHCPAALLVCSDKNIAWMRKYDGKSSVEVDASIVTTHMMLEAEQLGIGTCWVMHFNPEAVRTEFELPDHLEPVAILVMGYPADDTAPYPAHTLFRPADEIVIHL